MRFITLVTAFVLSYYSTQAQDIRSWWAAKPITVDGYANDWPETFRYYDGNTMLQFSIANDSNYFYLCLKANEQYTQRNLLRSGLAIWVDPKGKKKEQAGVVFPMKKEHGAPDAHERPEYQDPGAPRRAMNQMKQHVLLTQNSMLLFGLTPSGKDEVPLKNNEYGIQAGLSWDTLDIMTLEYRIPAKLLFGHSLTAADTSKGFSLGLVIAADQDERKMQRNGDADPNMDAGGMGNGGMMRNGAVGGDVGRSNDPMGSLGQQGGMGQSGGSMGNNGPPPNMYVAQDQKVWLKVRLVGIN